MKNSYKLFLLMVLMTSTQMFSCSTFNPDENSILAKVSCVPEKGWMANGYGELTFHYDNPTEKSFEIVKLVGTWYVGEDSITSWEVTKNTVINPGDSLKDGLIAWMPPKVVEKDKINAGSDPYIKGYSSMVSGNDTISEPFAIKVPVAVLDNPSIIKKGQHIAFDLETTTWDLVTNDQEMVRMMDEAYLVMKELTGNSPYNGELITFKECPENPYFAYAGNPIILNEKHVDKSVKRMDNSEFDFGWVHELGHDFDDVVGHWYNFGSFTEFMANIKLSYVIEKLVTNDSQYKFKSWVDTSKFVSGTAFNDEYFLPYGNEYMQSGRSWEELKSDEYHAMFHELIRKHGWEFMKKFFAKYMELSKSDLKIPETDQDKLQLICTILNKVCPGDQLAFYQKYRLPITQTQMLDLQEKYLLQ